MSNTILGFIAFICAIGGMLASSKVTIGLAFIAGPYVMFKISYCFRMLEIQEEQLKLLRKIKSSKENIKEAHP